MLYDSSNHTHPALEELTGIIKYRDLIFQLIYRDIVTRYKRSLLGVAWTMINPLGLMVVIAAIFSQLFHTIAGYPVYVLSGLIVWTFFAQSTIASLNQTIWGGSLFHRIYIPRTTFAISSIGTGLVNLFLTIFPLIAIMLFFKIPVKISFLFIPISMLLIGLFSLGIGLLVSTFALRFPDIAEMYQVILTAWMYLTPIFYPLEIIPSPFRKLIEVLNPMYYFVELFRTPIYNGELPSITILIPGIIFASTIFILGWFFFTKYRNELTYRV